jgi:hypothetical protein
MSSESIATLRRLADRFHALATTANAAAMRQRLTDLNGLREVGPVVLCFPENAWKDCLPAGDFACTDPVLRGWEWDLRHKIYTIETLRDDRMFDPVIDVQWRIDHGGWGVAIEEHRSGDAGGSAIWVPPIKDLDTDIGKLRQRQVVIDQAQTQRDLALAHEIFDGHLPVRLAGANPWSEGLTADLIRLIGLQPLMEAMLDNPEGLHRIMAWMRDERLHYTEQLRAAGALRPNSGDHYIGSGACGYSDELPPAGDGLQAPCGFDSLWGFAESQETVGISPRMFAEFILPYQLPLLSRYGLNYYGCCEPLDKRWQHVAKIPNLRRVSVSPWADVRKMAEYCGRSIIMARKVSPTPVCSGFDETSIRADLRRTLEDARGAHLEIILKDTHTVEGQPERLARWVQIAREEIDRAS